MLLYISLFLFLGISFLLMTKTYPSVFPYEYNKAVFRAIGGYQRRLYRTLITNQPKTHKTVIDAFPIFSPSLWMQNVTLFVYGRHIYVVI